MSFSGEIRRFRAGIDISGKAAADVQREAVHERLILAFSAAGKAAQPRKDWLRKIKAAK